MQWWQEGRQGMCTELHALGRNDSTLRRDQEEALCQGQSSMFWPDGCQLLEPMRKSIKEVSTVSSKRHCHSLNFWSSCVQGFKQRFIAQCSDTHFCSKQQRHLARGLADGIQPSHITQCWKVMGRRRKSAWKSRRNVTKWQRATKMWNWKNMQLGNLEKRKALYQYMAEKLQWWSGNCNVQHSARFLS